MRAVRFGTLSVVTIEQRCSLLKREAPSFDDKEVAERELERNPAAINDVVLPPNTPESDRVDVLVEDDRNGDDKVEHVEPFGTKAVWQDLDGISDD